MTRRRRSRHWLLISGKVAMLWRAKGKGTGREGRAVTTRAREDRTAFGSSWLSGAAETARNHGGRRGRQCDGKIQDADDEGQGGGKLVG